MAFGRTIPALPVRDVAAAVSYYAERLGFTVAHVESGFARVIRDDCEIHLWAANDKSWTARADFRERPVLSGAEDFIAGTASCRIEVDDPDAVHAEMSAAGILHPVMGGAPQVTDWGSRDVHVLDADGNLLTYFAPARSTA